ncbi:MAG: Rrf2 family transcriptional regulator [Actinobacteria bacterium]|nr:Rrf2 family transcriptional regulator [Actinomycetota bacterium]
MPQDRPPGDGLSRPACDISVLDVVEALEDVVLDVPRQADSVVAQMWLGAAESVRAYFGSVSIEQLYDRQREIQAGSSPMYHI